jgi:hypothetical protein
MSLQLPFGAPLHFSGVICMRPCSPAPPTADGLQVLSCIANDASMIGGTKEHDQPKWPQVARLGEHELPRCCPYFLKVAMIWSLQGENVVCLALSSRTTTRSSILTWAGDQPGPLIPQFNQSICPLGPLRLVISATHNNSSQNLRATNTALCGLYIPVAPTGWHLPALGGLIVPDPPGAGAGQFEAEF